MSEKIASNGKQDKSTDRSDRESGINDKDKVKAMSEKANEQATAREQLSEIMMIIYSASDSYESARELNLELYRINGELSLMAVQAMSASECSCIWSLSYAIAQALAIMARAALKTILASESYESEQDSSYSIAQECERAYECAIAIAKQAASDEIEATKAASYESDNSDLRALLESAYHHMSKSYRDYQAKQKRESESYIYFEYLKLLESMSASTAKALAASDKIEARAVSLLSAISKSGESGELYYPIGKQMSARERSRFYYRSFDLSSSLYEKASALISAASNLATAKSLLSSAQALVTISNATAFALAYLDNTHLSAARRSRVLSRKITFAKAKASELESMSESDREKARESNKQALLKAAISERSLLGDDSIYRFDLESLESFLLACDDLIKHCQAASINETAKERQTCYCGDYKCDECGECESEHECECKHCESGEQARFCKCYRESDESGESGRFECKCGEQYITNCTCGERFCKSEHEHIKREQALFNGELSDESFCFCHCLKCGKYCDKCECGELLQWASGESLES